MAKRKGATYAAAGVDISAADRFEDMIKERVRHAWPKAAQEIGGFAGGGPIPKGAVVVKGSTDGTGTKAIVAALVDRFDGLGIDAVAMGAVDMYVAGAFPTYLLDTLDVARLDPERHIRIINSVIHGCLAAGCRLIGGETAELPDLYRYPWMVNVNTTVIGFPDRRLRFVRVKPGQLAYGWPSDGPGSNGYSLLRKVFGLKGTPSQARQRLERHIPQLGYTLAEALLEPTTIWIPRIEKERRRGVRFAGHAHITGGGMPGNIPRILPPNCKVVIDRSRWMRPPIFRLTEKIGRVDEAEMDRTFNQGIMVVSIVADGNGRHPDTPAIGIVERRHKGEPQVQLIGKYRDS